MKRDGSSGRLGMALLMLMVVTLGLAPWAWAASNYKSLYAFTGGKEGGMPQAGLIFDAAGNLYGTTFAGGNSDKKGCYVGAGCGVVFKLTPNRDGRWTESVLYSFTGGADGGSPRGGLIFDAAGNLYGTTNFVWGSAFKLHPNQDGTWSLITLYPFCSVSGCTDGAYPTASMIFDRAGNLYGTTSEYGNTECGNMFLGCGVVFQLAPHPDGSWTENVLHTFGCGDGNNPFAGLVFDAAGNLYGTTAVGGGNTPCYLGEGGGVVFQLTPNADGSWKENVLHRFKFRRDGGVPFAGLILDAAGNLYGTTEAAGNLSSCGGFGCGVVFKLAPKPKGGWSETVLHAFHDEPGAWPQAGLIFDTAGNLYGTTFGDGSTTHGSVFEITP
jgi:uncharacterized repeat protein (TIGR03803 family)